MNSQHKFNNQLFIKDKFHFCADGFRHGSGNSIMRIQKFKSMRKILSISSITMLGAALTFTSCELTNDNGESLVSKNLSGTISANTTWKDLGLPVDYIIDGTLYIDGNALVTVEAGVTIMFTGTNGGINVGENAGFKIAGTAENPVVFTGPANNLNKGAWDCISVDSRRADNVWEYANFLNGGSGDGEFSSVIHVDGGKLGLKHCIIQGSASNGIALEWEGAQLTAFEGNTISGCEKYPMIIEQQTSYFCLEDNGNIFLPTNNNNVIALKNAGWSLDSDKDNTLIKMPVPYRFLGTLRLGGSQHFTIEAGTTIEMYSGCSLEIDDDVTFVAEGTATDLIKFIGDRDEKSYWGNIWYGSEKSASSIKYVDFKNGGKGDAGDRLTAIFVIDNNSKLTMENCTFSETEGAGISIDNANEIPGVNITGDTYSNCDEGNVRVSCEYWKEDAQEATITENQKFDDFAAVKAVL